MKLEREFLDEAVNLYLSWEKNEDALKAARTLVEENDVEKLKKCFTGDKLSFGTAGVRARMAPGFSALNHLTIIQLSHGLAKYLKEVKPAGDLSIVIGYDGRHQSDLFAKDAASVFLRNGIKVHLFTKVVPTPVVSFAVPFLECSVGLMITASHNPKTDNGYKVYWDNGAQIIEPHDVEICKHAFDGKQPNPDYFDWSVVNDNVKDCDFVLDEYVKSESKLCRHFDDNLKSKLKITYSAFHGVGYEAAMMMFKAFGFQENSIIPVKSQCSPDPEFSTLLNPNPEEGLKVLKTCLEVADESQSDIVLANDPDADRIQVAERQKDGTWRAFTGNEMGIVVTWWIWMHWKAENNGIDLQKAYILNSAVSSQFAGTMAKFEGFQHDIALTGFKWIGNLAYNLRSKNDHVILGWEESIGYMLGSTLDKDGVSAAAVFAEIATYLQNQGLKLVDQLTKIYDSYGYHLTRNSYFIASSRSDISSFFKHISANPPATIGSVAVSKVTDLTGHVSVQSQKLPITPTSPMIIYTLDTGSIVTLRASGTELKLKYYIELITPPKISEEGAKEVYNQLDALEQVVIDELIQSTPLNFTPRLK